MLLQLIPLLTVYALVIFNLSLSWLLHTILCKDLSANCFLCKCVLSLPSCKSNDTWVILLNLVHTGYLQFLTIFHNLAGNEPEFLPKTSKAPINTLKQLRFFLILLDFPRFFLYIAY